MAEEYIGSIKSFNPTKGWGFIESTKTQQIYGKDVFFLATTVANKEVNPGDKVAFRVKQGRNGVEAAEIRFLGAPGLRAANGFHAVPQPQPKQPIIATAPSSSPSSSGTVKSFNEVKGWGFITSEELFNQFGKDIFFLATGVVSGTVQPGVSVNFNLIEGRNGIQADNVRVAGSIYKAAAPRPQVQQRQVQRAPQPTYVPLPVVQYAPPPQQSRSAVPDQMFYGSIKSYNEEKGWGHILCEAANQVYGKDVFLRKGVLGESEPVVGTLVSFKVVQGLKGPQADQLAFLPHGAFAHNGEPSTRYTAFVKSYNVEKGWGFLSSPEIQGIFAKDIFIHKQDLGGVELAVGATAEFVVEPGTNGRLMAKAVSLEGLGPSAQEDAGNYHPAHQKGAGGYRASPY